MDFPTKKSGWEKRASDAPSTITTAAAMKEDFDAMLNLALIFKVDHTALPGFFMNVSQYFVDTSTIQALLADGKTEPMTKSFSVSTQTT